MADVWANSSQSHLPHCRVLPPGEFNVMIPELYVTLQGAATRRVQRPVIPELRITHIAGCCHLVNSLSWFQSHMPHFRDLAKSTSWSCHIAGCNNSIRHIENRFSPYFFFGFLNMHFGLWRVSAFVSSPIHLFTSVYQCQCIRFLARTACVTIHSVNLWSTQRPIYLESVRFLFCTSRRPYIRLDYLSKSASMPTPRDVPRCLWSVDVDGPPSSCSHARGSHVCDWQRHRDSKDAIVRIDASVLRCFLPLCCTWSHSLSLR